MSERRMTSAEAQAPISGRLVARMIIDFHRQMRDTYPDDVHSSMLCAVGPLQSMIGLAIQNGLLPPPPTTTGDE